MKNAVFLSASVPDPQRTPNYADCDPMAIRDAVVALAMETLKRDVPLVFGGHPSITVFLSRWAERTDRVDHVILYQSLFFEDKFPPEIRTIPNLHLVNRVEGDQNDNLAHFRRTMIEKNEIGMGVFMGGMGGLKEERDMLEKYHPNAILMPLRYLGGQTHKLFENDPLHPFVTEAFSQRFSPGGRFSYVMDRL